MAAWSCSTWSAKYWTPASMAETPAACTTKQATRTRNGLLDTATRSCARRDFSLSSTVPVAAVRVRKKTLSVPTTIISAMNTPMAR